MNSDGGLVVVVAVSDEVVVVGTAIQTRPAK